VRDLAVLRRRKRVLRDDVTPVDRGDIVLRSLLDPLHRPVQSAGEGDREQLLGVDVELRAEPAADVGCDDPHLRLVQAERRRGEHAEDVGDLRRGVERDVTRRPGDDEDGARLDGVRDQPRLVVAARHDHLGFLDRLAGRVGVEAPHVALVGAEIRVRKRRPVLERVSHVDDRVERLPVDVDELRRVLRLGPALRDHHRDAVALVTRDVGERIVRRVPHVLGTGRRTRIARLPVVGEVGGRTRRPPPGTARPEIT
jgi:hypothetical protein